MNEPSPPPRRLRVTLSGIMVVVAASALILGALRAAPVFGLLAIWFAVLAGPVEGVKRWLGLTRGRALVAVLAVYPWLVLLIMLATAGVDQSALKRSTLAGFLTVATVLGFVGSPIAAFLNFLISLALVVPIYYRGGSDREADAGRLLGLPLLSWLAAGGALLATLRLFLTG